MSTYTLTAKPSAPQGKHEVEASGVRVTRVLIGPELAEAMLNRNIAHNRGLRQHLVEKYASDMKAGRWKENAETIKFSPEGDLVDGQHRLWGVIESGVTIWFWVAENVPLSAFGTIDVGAKRSAADHLKFQGYLGGPLLSSACKLMHQYENNAYASGSSISNEIITSVINEHPGLNEATKTAKRLAKGAQMNGSSAAVFLHLIENHPKRDEFLNGVISGANLSQGDPRLALRNYYNGFERSKRRIDRGSTQARKLHLYAAINAFNDFITGQQRKQYRHGDLDSPMKPRIHFPATVTA